MLCSKIKEKINSKSPVRMKWCQSIIYIKKKSTCYLLYRHCIERCLPNLDFDESIVLCKTEKKRTHKIQVISWRHDVRYHLVIYGLAFCTIYRCSSVQCSKSSVCTWLQRAAVHCKHEFSRAGFSVLFSDFRGKINVRTVWDISFMRSGLSVIYGVFSFVLMLVVFQSQHWGQLNAQEKEA